MKKFDKKGKKIMICFMEYPEIQDFQDFFPGSSGFRRGSSRSKWIELHGGSNTCLDHLGFDDFLF